MYKDFYAEQQEQEIKEQREREIEKQQEQDKEDEQKREEYFQELEEQKIQERIDEDERVARLKQEIEEERQLKEQLEKEALELEEMDLKRLANEGMEEDPDALKQEEDARLDADAKEQEARSEQERQKTEMKLEQERNARQSVKDYAAGGKGFKEYVNQSSALRFQKRPRMQRLQEERGRQLEWHIRYQNAVQRNELDQWKSRDPENRGEYYQQRIEELEQATSAQLASEIQPVDLDQILAEFDEDRDVPTQDDILLKEALKENANDILREPQEDKDNVIQFPVNASKHETPIDLTPEELREANNVVESSINDIRPILNKSEHALYERQLGYLMADQIAEHDKNALSNYIETFKDDPEKFEKIAEHLVSLEALSEKELDEMKEGLFNSQDSERDFLSELDQDKMQIFDKVDDLYLNSLEADDCKFNAKINLSDAERQHASAYGALDQWIDHHREHHPEIFSLIQEKSALLLEEMIEKWPQYDKLSQQIEQIKVSEREQYEQELGESFGDRVGADATMAFDTDGYDSEEEYAEALSDIPLSQEKVIEFPSHRINQERVVERDESFNTLVDRYAEEGWPAGAEHDTGDYDRDDSDRVNELMGMEDQTKDIEKTQTLSQPEQSISQKQQLKLSREHHDDDWER